MIPKLEEIKYKPINKQNIRLMNFPAPGVFLRIQVTFLAKFKLESNTLFYTTTLSRLVYLCYFKFADVFI